MATDIFSEKDRLCQAIGKVVIEFQFIEYMVAEILASILKMREESDQHRVAAAMSFRQKTDLICDLYPTRRHAKWLEVDISLVRKALFASEDFRNRVVHSFWHVSGSEPMQWMRSKASLRSPAGLRVTTSTANIEVLEQGAKVMYGIRDWYVAEPPKLKRLLADLERLSEILNS
ncbi:hypothetical protein [Methylotenera sp. L2L1]|jgi:hypothetical protein|uniref:hypothetical protein n=1 Tax=Methylotenera sp. L2L1 TaxID=1502770 RepID=UPI000564B759|nr:hypothetical protein [Methylotenera sp. L2L1]